MPAGCGIGIHTAKSRPAGGTYSLVEHETPVFGDLLGRDGEGFRVGRRAGIIFRGHPEFASLIVPLAMPSCKWSFFIFSNSFTC